MNRASILAIPFVLGAFLVLAGSLGACNTVKGAGQDLKSAGQAIERKAEQKKHY
jgi:predicted small secreted protein